MFWGMAPMIWRAACAAESVSSAGNDHLIARHFYVMLVARCLPDALLFFESPWLFSQWFSEICWRLAFFGEFYWIIGKIVDSFCEEGDFCITVFLYITLLLSLNTCLSIKRSKLHCLLKESCKALSSWIKLKGESMLFSCFLPAKTSAKAKGKQLKASNPSNGTPVSKSVWVGLGWKNLSQMLQPPKNPCRRCSPPKRYFQP